MKKVSAKFFRDNLESLITRKYRSLYPHFEFQHRFLRMPAHPKIVVYSNVASVDGYLNQILNPKLSNQTDEILAKQVASQIVQTKDSSSQYIHQGVLIKGFPFNTTQALLLDRYLLGINLVINLKGGQQSQDLSSLLQYYNDRGNLVELDHKQKLTEQDMQNVQHKILSSIKRSE